VHDHKHHRLTTGTVAFRLSHEFAGVDSGFFEQSTIAKSHGTLVDDTFNTFSGYGFKGVDFNQLNTALLGTSNNGSRQWMFTGTLETRRESKQFCLTKPWSWNHSHQFWLSFGQRARLVDNECINFTKHLNRLGVFE